MVALAAGLRSNYMSDHAWNQQSAKPLTLRVERVRLATREGRNPMKHMFCSLILLAVVLVACENPMGHEGFNPVQMTVGIPYQDKVVLLGQNYYEFTTGAAGSYTIALTDTDSLLAWYLYSRADFSGYVANCYPQGYWYEQTVGDRILSVDLNSSTTYYLLVDEWELEADSYQLLITGP